MNWEETKKNSQQYLGKTPSYMLDAYGFDEANLDVTVRMDLSIKGQLLDNQYLWTVRFKTKFGRKLKEDRWVNNGLELDRDETIRKTAELEPGTDFNDRYTVMDSRANATPTVNDPLNTVISRFNVFSLTNPVMVNVHDRRYEVR
jgi:hypothetical protein